MRSIDPDHLPVLRQFVAAVRESRRIWGLASDEGWALCESNVAPGTEVMPFWSTAEAAAAHCEDAWDGYAPTEIDLDEFLEHWTLGMAGDGVLAGADWNEELDGPELEPEILEEWLLGERR